MGNNAARELPQPTMLELGHDLERSSAMLWLGLGQAYLSTVCIYVYIYIYAVYPYIEVGNFRNCCAGSWD